MKNKKYVIVDYKKSYNHGCVYSQTITLNKSFLNYINKMIKYYHNSSIEIQQIIEQQTKISNYYSYYLEELPKKEKYIFINLTTLKFIYYYLDINNYDISKIKYRNTRLKIKDL